MEKIFLTRDEAEALERLAEHERQSPGAVLRRLILAEAVRKGVWPALAGEVRDDDAQ